MTILNFINHIEYDKDVAMTRCMESEVWAAAITSLSENYLNCVSFDENNIEKIEFVEFITNNGFTVIKKPSVFLPTRLTYDITVKYPL